MALEGPSRQTPSKFVRPLIILSNDDGFQSPHLAAARAGLEELDVEVLVVAPERPRSASSHAITLHKPLRAVERARGCYAVSGSPVDCVCLAVWSLACRQPALVVSGINFGFNLGGDVFYSGTVGAAAEGVLRGVPGLAVSVAPSRKSDIDLTVRFTVALVERLLRQPLPPRTLLNVNVPADADGRYKWTRLGERVYEGVVDERVDPRGHRYYWFAGTVAERAHAPDTDCWAVENGVISLTPLYFDLTHREMLAADRPWRVDGYPEID